MAVECILRTGDCQSRGFGTSEIIDSKRVYTFIPVRIGRATLNGTIRIDVIIGCRRYTGQSDREEARPPKRKLPPSFLASRVQDENERKRNEDQHSGS